MVSQGFTLGLNLFVLYITALSDHVSCNIAVSEAVTSLYLNFDLARKVTNNLSH